MPDAIFENPRLAEIYDVFDGPRRDLPFYIQIAKELNAKSVIDVGCGTGCFSTLLAENGFSVMANDPAQASLKIALSKPHAEKVNWIFGDTSKLPASNADLAVMTGNVAQVFLTDKALKDNFASIHKALSPHGNLVFEIRDPDKKAWLKWNRDQTLSQIDIPNIGLVKSWCDVTNVSDKLVSFRWTYIFEHQGDTIYSDSTLRFWQQAEIEALLEETGFAVKEIRDAPDRPTQEFVFVTKVKPQAWPY